MNKIIGIALLLLISIGARAQYAQNGIIEYTKTMNIKMNMRLEFEKEMAENPFMKQMMDKMPKNMTKFYTMTFDQNKSAFSYLKDGPEKMPQFGGKDPASENIVVKEFKTNSLTAQKEIFDNIFIVKDSLPQYTWKIEDEIRQIAGYNCRKATTLIADSVVVVAFYTDEIMVSGGPESFGGLPGMILGLAIPRLYTTWFASSVDLVPYDKSLEKATKKGKVVTQKELYNQLEARLTEWGKFGNNLLWKSII